MLPMLYRKLLQKLPPFRLHYYLLTPSPRASSSLEISDLAAEQPPSLTISYLINSCGLSPQAALSASRKIQLKSTEIPDSVLQFLKTHGFNNTQISNLIASYPRFLLAKTESTFQPKVQFLQSLGLSNAELAEMVDSNPRIFHWGLNSRLIPYVDFLRSLLESNENVMKALKRSTWLLTRDLEKVIGANMNLFRELGMPNSLIAKMVVEQPETIMRKTDALREIAGRVETFGFERGSRMFMVAMQVMCSMSKLTWATKIDMLKSLGWLEEDILLAFRRCPGYMRCSEKKVRSLMDFYTKKMRWDPSFVSRYPKILMFSMKKRVIPRSRVYEILKSKELVNEDDRFITMLNLDDEGFLEKYVRKYEKEIPYLRKAYEGKLEFKWLDARGDGGKLD